jgi:hypothetical protein
MGLNWIFQNVWAIKLPWAKVVIGSNGMLLMVRCRMQKNMKSFFTFMFNGLWKHASHHKTLAMRPKVAIGYYYGSCVTKKGGCKT